VKVGCSITGSDVDGLTPGVAIVFQTFALYPWMTVTENVEVVLRATGLPAGEIKQRAEWSIRTLGLCGFEEAYPRELSGGMRSGGCRQHLPSRNVGL